MKNLIPGKRYEWPITIPSNNKIKSGLFTGNYDTKNGNAFFITKTGELWSVPSKNCSLVKKK